MIFFIDDIDIFQLVSMESSSLLPLVPLGVVAALPLARMPQPPMPLEAADVCSGDEVAEDSEPPEFSVEEEESPFEEEVAVAVRIREECRCCDELLTLVPVVAGATPSQPPPMPRF